MSESIIVGVVVGVLVAGGGAIISHYLRKWETESLWAEEERRRKSDRRRELYERDLKIVSDALDAFMELMGIIRWSSQYARDLSQEARAEFAKETYAIAWRARTVPRSLEDETLMEKYEELRASFNRWWDLLDLDTAVAKEGREVEFGASESKVVRLAAEVRRRIREVLEDSLTVGN